MTPLQTPTKKLRAHIIARHLRAAQRPPRVVCFTCGNAADALRAAQVDVIEVGPRGALQPTKWWTPERITRTWPHLFDATPGHLPLPLLVQLAHAVRGHHGPLEPHTTHHVPTGSGETILALRLAYPHCTFLPLHDPDDPATQHDPEAPVMTLPGYRRDH